MDRQIKTTSCIRRERDIVFNPHTNPMDAARVVARDKFVWPGGYLLCLVTADAGALCPDCVVSEYALIYESHKTDGADEWQPAGMLCAAEVESMGICDHCGRNMDEI